MPVQARLDGPQLGRLLRERRQSLGLTLHQVARRAHVHAATLSRYETVGRIHADRAALLDRAYEGEGVIASAILGAAGGAPWRPDPSEEPQRLHVHRWPAAHDGVVWLLAAPSPRHIGKPHRLQLQWGPWQQLIDLFALPLMGAAVWTGKSRDDGPAVDFSCGVEPACFVIFGVNEPPMPALDARSGWRGAT